MIAVDTNILVYSVREDSRWHKPALRCIRALAEGGENWGIPWPCIHEFLAVVTNPGIYDSATPLEQALRQVEYWMESPTLQILGENRAYWLHLQHVLLLSQVRGGAIHDARIAAICRASGVTELWTADRDFSRFPGLVVRNPLVG
ncbi:MAG: PIN domain-containing protein [Bryobacteraceae bacterium]|nr:PIN domain-containing protein [Bryobacteraceae bacterium]